VSARVYLDHNAGAPLHPAVRDAMLAYLGPAGNPSSPHREGARARSAVEQARAQVAALIGAAAAEIVFTSGATEANNLALRGVFSHVLPDATLVTSAIEHASILATARALGERGVSTTLLPVDHEGQLDPAAVRAACSSRTRLVSVALANGEVGTVVPLGSIVASLGTARPLVHTDAAQAAGRLPIAVRELGLDLLSLSSHKLGGPAGVGALWARRGVSLTPLVTGGPQERGVRAGTENVAGIVGFGVAAEIAGRDLERSVTHMQRLGDILWELLRTRLPDIVRNGPGSGQRLPNTLNVTVPGCAGESLLLLLDLAGVAVSTGSACAAGAPEPSHVLLAMGRDSETARAGLRISFGPATTVGEIERVADALPAAVRQVRAGAAA